MVLRCIVVLMGCIDTLLLVGKVGWFEVGCRDFGVRERMFKSWKFGNKVGCVCDETISN